MRWKIYVMSVLALSLATLAGPARSEPAPATPPAATQPAVEDIQDKVLPNLDIQSISLKDFLDYISSTIPGFQGVIVRDPSVPADYPVLPDMKLKKVTLGQVLSIIQETFPSIEFHPIESEKGSIIYLFKIHGAMSGLTELSPQTVLRIYRLTDAVDALGARNLKAANTTKEMLEPVLSLIKAALTQAGDPGVNPVIQVHEETLTLILRGTSNQVDAVQRALEALTPGAVLAPLRERLEETEHRYEAELARKSQELEQLKVQLETVRAEAESMHKAVLEHESAEERLKIRFEAVQKNPASKE